MTSKPPTLLRYSERHLRAPNADDSQPAHTFDALLLSLTEETRPEPPFFAGAAWAGIASHTIFSYLQRRLTENVTSPEALLEGLGER